MFFNYFKDMIAEHMMQVVLWTFIHSLWQGGLAVIAAVLIVKLTRGARSRVRYNLLLSVFGLLVLTTFLTFWTLIFTHHEPKQLKMQTSVPTVQAPLSPGESFRGVEPGPASWSLTSAMQEFVNNHSGVLFCIWFVIFLFQLARLIQSYMVNRAEGL
jgi:hypothetical protein